MDAYTQKGKEMKKKIFRGIILVGLVVVCVGQAVYAASSSVYYQLGSTGTVFTVCATSDNVKSYVADKWSVYLSTCDLGQNYGGYGWAFKPLYQVGGSWYSAGDHEWILSPGWVHGDYTYAKKINYRLGGRIDDAYSFSCTADGYWNADYIY